MGASALLEQMLANLPESSVIDRMSLEARKSQVEEAIATALTDCETGRDRLLEALKEALAEVEATTKESIVGVGQKAQHRLWMARMRSVIQDAEEREG
jgi:hypothetical protein